MQWPGVWAEGLVLWHGGDEAICCCYYSPGGGNHPDRLRILNFYHRPRRLLYGFLKSDQV
jgi:hypothetical protein